jgi:hypothetical protein
VLEAADLVGAALAAGLDQAALGELELDRLEAAVAVGGEAHGGVAAGEQAEVEARADRGLEGVDVGGGDAEVDEREAQGLAGGQRGGLVDLVVQALEDAHGVAGARVLARVGERAEGAGAGVVAVAGDDGGARTRRARAGCCPRAT